MSYLTTTFHPEGFHGRGRTKRYFEGWYLKCVSADRNARWAFIPGIFLGPDGGGEAFVQVLDGSTNRSWFHSFPLSEFHAEEDRFEVKVGPNRFSAKGLTLDLPATEGAGAIRGELTFNEGQGLTGWPVTKRSPGIMGPFGLIPFMECSHGLVSFSHGLRGTLEVDGVATSFDQGLGYIEKDWGAAFPSAYVWMQTNHFTRPNACLSASIAIIPTMPKNAAASMLDTAAQFLVRQPASSFRGFIVGLWIDGTLHPFATWSGAKTELLSIDDRLVKWTMRNRTQRLELVTERVAGGLLHAPLRTQMHRRVVESIDARVQVRLTSLKGEVLFEDLGVCGGLEVFGELERLQSY